MTGHPVRPGDAASVPAGDSAQHDSEALSNRFPDTARHAVYVQFDDPAAEPWYHPHALVTDNGDGTLTITPGEHQALAIPALIPDPRTTSEVPF